MRAAPNRDRRSADTRGSVQRRDCNRLVGLLLCASRARSALGIAGAWRRGPETEQALRNLEAVLVAAGLTFRDVVRSTIYLADIGDFDLVNEIYGRSMAEPLPARTTVGVAALPLGARIEIEMTAVRA